MSARTFPIVMSAPSGGGKTTIARLLLERRTDVGYSVSCTTRAPRPGEVDGREYDFVDDATFDRLVAEDAFVEWAPVHLHRYGTRRSRLAEMERAGKVPVLDIDVQGGLNVLKQFGDELVAVFLVPPSWAELERRLRSRGTESEEAIATRLRNARHEVGLADHYAYWVVNDEVEAAVGRLSAIVAAEACRARGRAPLG